LVNLAFWTNSVYIVYILQFLVTLIFGCLYNSSLFWQNGLGTKNIKYSWLFWSEFSTWGKVEENYHQPPFLLPLKFNEMSCHSTQVLKPIKTKESFLRIEFVLRFTSNECCIKLFSHMFAYVCYIRTNMRIGVIAKTWSHM
jgi:hypothetical protein